MCYRSPLAGTRSREPKIVCIFETAAAAATVAVAAKKKNEGRKAINALHLPPTVATLTVSRVCSIVVAVFSVSASVDSIRSLLNSAQLSVTETRVAQQPATRGAPKGQLCHD